MRQTICAVLAAGSVLLGAGCVTNKFAPIPPPESDCPTEADIEELARLLPRLVEPAEVIELEELAGRFIDAAAYCAMAERRLR